MKCDKCGAELKSGAKFCTVCGEKVEVQRICPNCGKPIKDGAKFCRECGAAVNTVDNTSINTEQVKYAAPVPVKSSKNDFEYTYHRHEYFPLYQDDELLFYRH